MDLCTPKAQDRREIVNRIGVMAFLSMGFRPFFLLAAIWAALSMLIWIGFWAGADWLASPMAPLDWHMHELLFGYGGAVLCGFLLTAVPNWTGREALSGLPLAGLVALWLLARVALMVDLGLPPMALMVLDLAFPLVFCLFTVRELLAAGNKRNLPVLALCVLFMLANAAFHIEAIRFGSALGGVGTRLGLAALVLLIGLIGGRIIPAFTGNWLKAKGEAPLPTQFGKFDIATLAATAVALIGWVAWGEALITGALMLIAAVLHVMRQMRWRAGAVRGEALLFALHLAYHFLPLGFVLGGLSILAPLWVPGSAAIHAWTAGAIGLMTLTVMSRASLGHSGLALVAGWAEIAFLYTVFAAAILRIIAAWPQSPEWVLHLSATLWILGFAGFALRFLPVMIAPHKLA